MRLLMACWGTAAGRCVPLAGAQLAIALWQDGFTWGALRQQTASALLAWGAVALAVAVIGSLSLRKRARRAGVPLSVEALDERQTHLLRAAPVADGWQQRVRDELTASERVFLVAEKGREELHFRWRPGRGGQSVWGTMAFDATSGDVCLDVRDEEGLLGVAGLGKGASFAAVCQIARATGLSPAPGGGLTGP
ncbi:MULTISPECIES: hypothetical protein [unclassified Streptomyces]|uniref:hypothetical protein n=1 Tax=unclassified Streptomyces TaxID=2593676 RepID=UPI00365BBA00